MQQVKHYGIILFLLIVLLTVIPMGTVHAGWTYGSRVSSSERELLARVVEAEAGGEPYIGKVSVAAVVLNRVSDPRFPNTIRGVIFQKYAFESVSNGFIWRLTPGWETYNAVQDALNGWDPTYRSVFFWNPYRQVNPWIWSRPIVTQYGNHVFAV